MTHDRARKRTRWKAAKGGKRTLAAREIKGRPCGTGVGDMRTSKPNGTPFTAGSADRIDQWSRGVFRALSGWAETLNGRWTRYDGYLLLEIDRLGGDTIEPILIDTADDELRVEFGYWETELSEAAVDAEGAAQEAIKLVSDWLSGNIRTAVFTNDAGHWCGSMVIERDEPVPPGPSEGMLSFRPTKVEVRSPQRQHWETYPI